MVNLHGFVAIGALALAAGQCQPRLGMLEVPASVQAGHEFSITVHGNDAWALGGGQVGCVVQLPANVAINGFLATSQGLGPMPSVTRDRAALLGLYTAEPGHYLASFDAMLWATNAALTLFLHAPASAAVPLTVKVSIAGDVPVLWTANDPPGLTDFAAIGGAHAKSFTLVPDPPHFARVAAGLPAMACAAFGDIDGDGNDDLVGVELGSTVHNLHACLSRPGAAWQTVTTSILPVAPTPQIALGHFDGDGHLDVAIPGQFWFGDGQGGFVLVQAPNVGFVVNFVAAGDVDADGLDDLACVGQQTVAAVLRSNGNRTFGNWSNGLPTQPVQNQFFLRSLLRDLTHDGFADLVVPKQGIATLEVYVGDGAGNWTHTSLATSNTVSDLEAGDLSGDGRDDLVVALAYNPDLLQVFEYLGGGLWGVVPLPPVSATDATEIVLLDYDRDGRLDVVAADAPGQGTYAMWHRLRLLRNTGTGSLVEVVDVGLSTYGQRAPWLATGDLDGDTFPDLAMKMPVVWRNTSTGLSPYGTGCADAGHAPWLDANGLPLLGNAGFALHLHDGLANGGGLLWLGFSKRYAFGVPQLPFELTGFGAPGCSVLAEQVAVRFVLHDAQGFAAMPLPLPNDPSLHRLLVFAQGAALVPGANPLGALFSGGMALRLD